MLLTEPDKVRINEADQMRQAQDRSQSCPRSAWCTRMKDLPLALVYDFPCTKLRVSASVLRWREEEEYVRRALRVWDQAMQDPATLTCEPRPEMVALGHPS